MEESRKSSAEGRKDQGIDIILRIYAPYLEKMKIWKALLPRR